LEALSQVQTVSGVTMLSKDDATTIRNHALRAIHELMELVYFSKDKCSPEQHQQIEHGVGLSIGRIQMEILEVINAAYPELDDLIEDDGNQEKSIHDGLPSPSSNP
jgi:hypothetical protein